jgi:hypothetical protein
MDLEMVLNELSLHSPAPDIHIARQRMSTLLRTMRIAIQNGVNRVLRTHENFYGESLASGYSIANWRNDFNVDREEQRYFRSLATKAPYWMDLRESEIKDNLYLSEFQYNGTHAHGLGFAYLIEAIALSLCSEVQWDASHIELEATRLGDDENIFTEQVMVVHASRVDHVQEHTAWIQNRLRTSVRDGIDLWNRRESLFASLGFCDAVSDHIQSLHAGNPLLRSVVRRLLELEYYCRSWERGPFNAQQLPTKASLESQVTLQQFGRERTFLCPDGMERLFTWHVRLTPEAWRIHFFPEAQTRTIIVGYIGPHLPTVSDPT